MPMIDSMLGMKTMIDGLIFEENSGRISSQLSEKVVNIRLFMADVKTSQVLIYSTNGKPINLNLCILHI